MRVLVTGSSGFLGQVIRRYVRRLPACEFIYCSRQVCKDTLEVSGSWERVSGEAETDRHALAKLDADVILHFSALSSPALCERDPRMSRSANVDYTRMLAELASDSGAYLLFPSTDWVFDGNSYQRPFTEEDEPRALSTYARDKRAAEQILLSKDYRDRSLILRLSLVFGAPLENAGTAAWMFDCFQSGKAFSLFHDEYRTPLYSRDFVDVIAFFLNNPFSGLYHCGGRERLNRYDMGSMLADVFGFNTNAIQRSSRLACEGSLMRPEDLSLDSSALYRKLSIQCCSFKESLENLRLEYPS